MIDSHLTIEEINQDNYRYYEVTPDPDFSPERNFSVINKIVENTKQMRFGVNSKVRDAAEDKADILSSFAKYKLDIGGGKTIEQWLGKDRLNQLYSEQLKEKIRLMQSAERLKQ